MTSLSPARGALVGVSAAAVALGVAELTAIATGARGAPLVAVGATVVDLSPEPMTQFGITVFGTYNRLALLAGILLLLAAAAATIGVAATRRRWIGYAGLVAFGALGVTAALTRHDAEAVAAVPTVAGVLAGVGCFHLLSRRDGHSGEPVADRRGFLQLAGVLIGVAAAAGVGGRWLSTRRGVATARGQVTLPAPADPAAPVPADADLRLPDLASYVTGNDDFYRIDTALVVPQVDPRDWTLRIHGRVRHPYELTFAQLLERQMIERHITLACVSNQVGGELIGNARWLGVPVADLLEAAGPLPGADQVVSRSVDGWTCGTPTEVLTDGRDALLAIGMNGQPLPPAHGFPVRMVVPGLYGYVSACKWITEIELSSFDDYDAYWVPRGWAPRAPVKTQSRIDTPRRRAEAGPVTVAGVAWAQHRGIERVEVRVDDGPWQEATLAGAVSADTWRQWSWQWRDAPAGEHEITVRATDSTGHTQPQQPQPPAPDGATGWHSVRVEVR